MASTSLRSIVPVRVFPSDLRLLSDSSKGLSFSAKWSNKLTRASSVFWGVVTLKSYAELNLMYPGSFTDSLLMMMIIIIIHLFAPQLRLLVSSMTEIP